MLRERTQELSIETAPLHSGHFWTNFSHVCVYYSYLLWGLVFWDQSFLDTVCFCTPSRTMFMKMICIMVVFLLFLLVLKWKYWYIWTQEMNLFAQAFEAIASSSGAYKCKTKCIVFMVVYMVFIAFNAIVVLETKCIVFMHSSKKLASRLIFHQNLGWERENLGWERNLLKNLTFSDNIDNFVGIHFFCHFFGPKGRLRQFVCF